MIPDFTRVIFRTVGAAHSRFLRMLCLSDKSKAQHFAEKAKCGARTNSESSRSTNAVRFPIAAAGIAQLLESVLLAIERLKSSAGFDSLPGISAVSVTP